MRRVLVTHDPSSFCPLTSTRDVLTLANLTNNNLNNSAAIASAGDLPESSDNIDSSHHHEFPKSITYGGVVFYFAHDKRYHA